MIRIGAEELLLIFLLALLLFGPGRLSAIARELGQSVREFRRGLMEEPSEAPRSPGREPPGHAIAGSGEGKGEVHVQGPEPPGPPASAP